MTSSGLQPPIVRIVPVGSPAGPKPHSHAEGETASDAAGPPRSVVQIAKDIGLFAAAPFVTLAYISLFPFIGLVMLAQAWRHRREVG
jgi:hypothetical protein